MNALTDVCIVGAGPTGLLAANLLGAAGVTVLLVERNLTTSSDAKAISLDDESMRTMLRAGLGPWVETIVSPGTGTSFYGRRGQLLCHARGPEPPFHGYAIKSPFAQPELEAALLEALRRFPELEIAFGTSLVGLKQRDDGVEVDLMADGAVRTVRARYVLGCDGGRSAVREMLKIAMHGKSFRDRWIVIDTVADAHTQRYGMHMGDPRRPEVIIPGANGRCRYEFLLSPDEAPDDRADPALVKALLEKHRTIGQDQIERSTIYRFNAVVAERWRDRRCFLLGDAAHMMPPFAGQGLNSGIRDVNNLAWKLERVLQGRMRPTLLDTYEVERKPHAEATVKMSVRMGSIVMTTSLAMAATRDVLIGLAMLTPWGRSYLQEMRFRPPQRYAQGFVRRNGSTGEQIGTTLAQPLVLRPGGSVGLADKVLGGGFSLLAVELAQWPPGQAVELLAQVLDARRIRVAFDRFPVDDEWMAITDYDGGLRRQLASHVGRLVLVRPDRFIAASFVPEAADETLETFSSYLSGAAAALGPDKSPTAYPTEVIS